MQSAVAYPKQSTVQTESAAADVLRTFGATWRIGLIAHVRPVIVRPVITRPGDTLDRTCKVRRNGETRVGDLQLHL